MSIEAFVTISVGSINLQFQYGNLIVMEQA